MGAIARSARSLTWLSLVLAAAPVALGGEKTPGLTRVLDARVGRTPRGVPRVVVETDRPVQFLTVELAQENGFEVHLLGTDPLRIPPSNPLDDPVVRSVTFRPGPQGLVARVRLAERRAGRAFPLETPPRIVLDLLPLADPTPDVSAPSAPSAPPEHSAPASTQPTAHASTEFAPPVAAAVGSSAGPDLPSVPPGRPTGRGTNAPTTTRNERTETTPTTSPPEPPRASDRADRHETARLDSAAAEVDDRPGDRSTRGAPAASAGAEPPSEERELLGWIQGLRAAIDTIRDSRTGDARADARRRLARLLAERGLWAEAEKAMLSAAMTGRSDRARAADSLAAARLRLKRGDTDGALAIAAALDTARIGAVDRVELAEVLLATDRPAEAETVLSPVMTSLDPPEHSRASYLLANSLWAQGEPAKALPLAAEVTAFTGTPADVLPAALLLQADCLWSLDRAGEAKGLYERAATLPLGPEEASWATLQLGNLARREGRLDDARRHYETAKERWPDTFYASQADWFLRFDERLRTLRGRDAGKDRG